MPARKSTAETSKPKSAPKRRPAKTAKTAKTARKLQIVADHAAVAERAYFIHLSEGSQDEVANWLRAEREMAAA